MTPEELDADLAADEVVSLKARHSREIAAARRHAQVADRRAAEAEKQVGELQQVVSLFGRLDGSNPSPPKWMTTAKAKGAHRGTVMLLLSDCHFDEVVRPEEVDGLNAYDRRIATARLERWARNVSKLTRHFLSGVRYDGCVLMLGGDTFSGLLHEELVETNEDTILGSLLYWTEQVCAAVDLLADDFGRVHIEAVPGNHGRLTRKPRHKLRARDNLDWLLANLVARQFARDKRVTCHVGDGADAHFEVYGRGHLLTHGDQVNGGGGIGGIWPPIKRMQARKAEHHMTVGRPFDVLWMGHWHQLIQTPSLVVNGALKGFDEYAKNNNFRFEPPQQALALVTPEHGITWQAPVFCADRPKEGW